MREKLRVQEALLSANREKQAAYLAKESAAAGLRRLVPVFPVGDALLEPFWPQGLGSNRGFHSALDAAWAVRELHAAGLDAALLERSFAYDVMLQSAWQPELLKPAKGWHADPVSRYKNGALLDTMRLYTSLTSKRLFKGEGAVPPRLTALKLQREKH